MNTAAAADSAIDDKVEKLATADGLRVVRLARVVILVVDAAAPLDKQDLTIARMVIDEGRALLVAVNKWDAAEDKEAVMKLVEDRLQTSLNQARGVRVVTISALREIRLEALHLIANLRGSFDLPGVPLRLLLRGGKNPYAPKS